MGDLSGRISAVIVENVGGALQFDETVIYSISDNIKIESIRHFKHEEFMYIILCKGTMVIAAVFNADCEVLDQKLFQCGNLGIAGDCYTLIKVNTCKLLFFRIRTLRE